MSHTWSKLVIGIATASLPLGGFALATSAAAADPAAEPAGTQAGTESVVRDPHGTHEPSATEIRPVDGTNVVFAYGEVLPAFDGWDGVKQQPTRDYRSLDGRWKFRYDPENVGEQNQWFRPDLDDSDWDGIDVPSAWDLKDNDGWPGYAAEDFGKGGSLKDGYAWYRTSVEIPSDWQGTHVRLAFLAAAYSADVWVNGQWVGKHEGGNTPFALPVDGLLDPGTEASIAVRVYRRATYTSYDGNGAAVVDDYALPGGPVDQWPYAGLTRSVWLESVPGVTISKLLLAAGGSLDARVIVENHTDKAFRGKVIVDPGRGSNGRPATAKVDVPAGGVDVPAVRVPLPDAPKWSAERPNTLQARANLLDASGQRVDTLSDTYGVRTVGVADAKLRVNGRPVYLKGTNWHEETPQSGRAMTRAEYDEKLGRIERLGANFVRNCVYSRHPYSYDWTDRHGLYVLDEWDTFWVTTRQQEIQLEYGLSRALAATTAWNNHNHPSVVMWGLQNESTIDTATYRAWLADMKQAVKLVDLSDRPVTWASNSSNDKAFDLADVVGFNEYFGYFYGKNEDLGPAVGATHANHPDKPILITENGSWAWPLGNHGDPTEVGTEDWQAANFRSHWNQLVGRDFVTGYAFWVFEDYKQRANYNMSLNGMSGMGMRSWGGAHERMVLADFDDAQSR